MNNLKSGMIRTMHVLRPIGVGYILKQGKDEIFLHNNEVTEPPQIGNDVEVFLYEDKKGQLVASTVIPEVTLDTFGWVKVVGVVDDLGVFVNIGLQKDILASKDDLPLHTSVWPKIGDHLFVRLDHDRRGKLIAKPVTEEIINKEKDDAPKELLNQTISGHIYRSSKIGSFLITEQGYRGFIHFEERKDEPRLGQYVKGRVIDVKDDGSINVSLRPMVIESRDEDAEQLLNFLRVNNGAMPFSDKSTPDEIRENFQLSKAAFKRAMGKLIKEKNVIQKDGETILIHDNKDEPEES